MDTPKTDLILGLRASHAFSALGMAGLHDRSTHLCVCARQVTAAATAFGSNEPVFPEDGCPGVKQGEAPCLAVSPGEWPP